MDPTNVDLSSADREKLRALLQEGEDNGPPVLMTREEWDKVWQEATSTRGGPGSVS
jgi:hypothetical protein